MVSSLDGVVSLQDGHSVGTWTSDEDKKRLQKEIKSADAIIVGRRSFRENFLKITNASIYVLTNNKTLLADKHNDRVYYTDVTPRNLKKMLNAKKYTNVILLGGVTTNTEFLLRGLVDDLKLTVEPHLFGTGLPFIDYIKTFISLKLVSVKRANPKGTLFLHYSIKNNKQLSKQYVNRALKTQTIFISKWTGFCRYRHS